MPQFTVNLPDGGQVVVNASDPAAAAKNVGAPAGSVITSGSYSGGGSARSSAPSNTPAQQTGGVSSQPAGNWQAGSDVYQTTNGPRTTEQMRQELMQAGWDGRGTIQDAYSRTAGGPVRFAGGQTGVSSTGATGQVLAPGWQQQAPAVDPNEAAYQAYLNAQNQFERQKWEFEKQRATLDMQLARNADARADANLRLQQASQELSRLTFEESQRQFQQNLAQRQLEFGKTFEQGQREFNQTQYTGLANTLLQGAANLRGPQDWLQYAQFTGGGRNLEQQLFGGDPNAQFGGEQGPSPAITVGGVMNQLGFVGGNPPVAQQPPNVPLPHQIAPAQWDAMSPQAQQLALGLAQGGYTSKGVYTPEDYQRILNASRPYGSASRVTQSRYAAPQGVM